MELLKPDIGLVFWLTVTLLIAIPLLRKLAWEPLMRTLEEREKRIQEALESARMAEEKARRLEQEYARMKEEMARERARITQELQKVYAEKLREAEERARQRETEILRKAQEEARRLYERTRAELLHEVGDLVIQLAERILREELADRNKARAYIQRLLKELPVESEKVSGE